MLTILHKIFEDWLIAPKGAVVTPRHRLGMMMSPGFFPPCMEPNVSVYDAHKKALSGPLHV